MTVPPGLAGREDEEEGTGEAAALMAAAAEAWSNGTDPLEIRREAVGEG